MDTLIPVLNNNTSRIDVVRRDNEIPENTVSLKNFRSSEDVYTLHEIVPAECEPERRVNKAGCISRKTLLVRKIR